MALPHYIGLTGPRTPEEAEAAVQIFHAHGFVPGAKHTNMIGVLTNPNTLEGKEPLHCKKPWRQVENVRVLVDTLLRVQGKGIPMIHMELHKVWPGTPGDADHAVTLLRALEREGVKPAIQLNGIITPDDVWRVHGEAGADIVIQLRKELMSRGDGDVASYVQAVGANIAKILIDASAGTGKEFQPAEAARWHRFLQTVVPDSVQFGYAGGLSGANTLTKVRQLRAILDNTAFSIDIESGARMPESDLLDLRPGGAFEQYVAAAAGGLR